MRRFVTVYDLAHALGLSVAVWLGFFALAGCSTVEKASDRGEVLSIQLAKFHRAPTQRAFTAILVQFHDHDGDADIRANASLMAAFLLFAADHYGLSVVGAPDSLPLQRFLAAERAKFMTWVEDGTSASPEKNDVLWVGFYCTGESRYLDRLFALATTAIPTSPDGKSPVIDLSVSTARWSYKSNSAQWPEVLAHAQHQSAAGNAFAKECVEYAKAHPEAMNP